MKYWIVFIGLFLGSSTSSFAQLKFHAPGVSYGYTLIDAVEGFYLIDNCGDIVHEWEYFSHRYHAKLLENGNLIFHQSYGITAPYSITELDWDGNVVNTIYGDYPDLYLKYEVIKLSNGNYLSVARLKRDPGFFFNLGYDTGWPNNPSEIDVVVEIDSVTGAVVWLWDISDHVIQEQSSNLNNYGSVMENPQLLNMGAVSTFDWQSPETFMINGMDYNEELDQIMLSVRKMSEIIIIDHSTTTEEAAGHTGGNSGKGGDILYRWGNPQNYNRGTEEDRFLFYQHNPNWIKHGEHKGKVMIFDNGLNRPDLDYSDSYSSVPIIELPVDEQGNYLLEDNLSYGPALPVEHYSELTGSPWFYSGHTSGAQVLWNGNIFIVQGSGQEIFELNPEGELLWHYEVPGPGYLFRAEKYPLDYPAFEGRDLTPSGTIEGPPSTVDCIPSSVDDLLDDEKFEVWLDNNFSQLHISSFDAAAFQYKIIDLSGRVLFSAKGQGSLQQSLESFATGIYVVQVIDNKSGRFLTKKIAVR